MKGLRFYFLFIFNIRCSISSIIIYMKKFCSQQFWLAESSAIKPVNSLSIYGTLTPSHKSGKKWGKVSGPTRFAGPYSGHSRGLRVRLKSICKPRKGLGLFASLFASQLSFQLSTLSSLD